MERHLESRRVREIMTAKPHWIALDATVGDLQRSFEVHDFNAFPVIDRDRVLRGIVTKLDLLRAFRADARGRVPDPSALTDLPIADIMRPGILTLEPDDPAIAAVDLMLESRLHSLPVVERRRGGPPQLVGMVSRGDLLRQISAERKAPEADVARRQSARPRPRSKTAR